jgi:uncharacterized phage-associated protein
VHRFKSTLLKQIQAVAILVQLEGGRIDRLRLLTLLYLADREMLAERGTPIVGGRVAALESGPAHSAVLEMIRGEHPDAGAWSDFFRTEGHQVALIEDPNRLELSPSEIEKLTAISDAHRTIDTWCLVQIARDLPEWKQTFSPSRTRPIPAEQILEALVIPSDDIAEICREAESHARMLQAVHVVEPVPDATGSV